MDELDRQKIMLLADKHFREKYPGVAEGRERRQGRWFSGLVSFVGAVFLAIKMIW